MPYAIICYNYPMEKISSARIDMEKARIDNALFKDYGEILVGGATGAKDTRQFNRFD